jgi:hypothetical protein
MPTSGCGCRQLAPQNSTWVCCKLPISEINPERCPGARCPLSCSKWTNMQYLFIDIPDGFKCGGQQDCGGTIMFEGALEVCEWVGMGSTLCADPAASGCRVFGWRSWLWEFIVQGYGVCEYGRCASPDDSPMGTYDLKSKGQPGGCPDCPDQVVVYP